MKKYKLGKMSRIMVAIAIIYYFGVILEIINLFLAQEIQAKYMLIGCAVIQIAFLLTALCRINRNNIHNRYGVSNLLFGVALLVTIVYTIYNLSLTGLFTFNSGDRTFPLFYVIPLLIMIAIIIVQIAYDNSEVKEMFSRPKVKKEKPKKIKEELVDEEDLIVEEELPKEEPKEEPVEEPAQEDLVEEEEGLGGLEEAPKEGPAISEEPVQEEIKEEESQDSEQPKEKVSNLIIVFNSTANPGFEFLYFNNQKKLIGSEKVSLDSDQLEDGLPIGTLNLGSMLKEHIPSGIKNASILLDSDKIYKATNVYPRINRFRLKAIYANDIKQSYGDSKEKHHTFIQEYHNNMEYIIYTYFIPNSLYNFALKLARALNLKLETVDIYARFLLNNILKNVDGNFIYAYAHHDLITLIVSYSKLLTGTISFEKETSALNRNVYGIGIKHFYELEKESVEKLFTNFDDIPCDVLEVEKRDIVLDSSLQTGVKK